MQGKEKSMIEVGQADRRKFDRELAKYVIPGYERK
jgi:hypothetical protein